MRAHKATIIVDLGFGDAGKGSIVDFLARRGNVAAVVRFNGGAQAAHNVVTPAGMHHTFAQFGSGTFVSGVRTHLSRFMLVDPLALATEAKHLQDLDMGNVFARLTVDEDAMVVTPFHKAANRLREVLRGSGRHGSCGMGVGEAVADSLWFPDRPVRARDLRDLETLLDKFRFFQELKRDEFRSWQRELAESIPAQMEWRLLTDPDAPAFYASLCHRIARRFAVVGGAYLARLAAGGHLLFEGAQGVLLDELHGFHPYTTWSNTTFENAQTLLREIGYDGEIERMGVLRTYATRHGAGPFVTEDAALTTLLPDPHNGTGRWQGAFRSGWLDLVMARYALEVCGGADSLAITFLDRLRAAGRRLAVSYKARSDAFTESERAAVKLVVSPDPAVEVIERLRRNPVRTNLAYREMLTQLLTKVVPVYRDAAALVDDASFLAMLERDLTVPISIASYGPTTNDKRIRGRERLAA
jgi:adenylosuccinate synthase